MRKKFKHYSINMMQIEVEDFAMTRFVDWLLSWDQETMLMLIQCSKLQGNPLKKLLTE